MLERCFAEVNRQLDRHGLILRKGTILDASLVKAAHKPPSGKGVASGDRHPREPGADWTRKDGKAHFGYRIQVGLDQGSGLIRRVAPTPARVQDADCAGMLVSGDEAAVGRSAAANWPLRRYSVFINCPFDPEYRPLFRAMCFPIARAREAVRVQLRGSAVPPNLAALPCSWRSGQDNKIGSPAAATTSAVGTISCLSRLASRHRDPGARAYAPHAHAREALQDAAVPVVRVRPQDRRAADRG